ncbi:glycine cleavage system aminomethyltransferase GcvT [Bacillus mangrovi]|uniref:Aminomethyltransferase n=1 Tax=Metabacillus mangrovi TaxID=1491830 RepID=A0A7X2V3G4_9BACI|nr:glycine cleavage system aminomethyltransferase GcvT [Metabacillus mangrovi]MTH52380.1 glycine cleavage system aminomethyltransferase GcvT [Metabacillus mangrovi]
MSELKRTPLFSLYKEYGGKTIDFGGWELPVQFSSIKEEHEAVRTRAGLFDVSHMGEVSVKGKDSLAFLQKLLTNDPASLKDGAAQYTAMCYEDGGTVDDLLVYKLAENEYMAVINASNIEKDLDWMRQHAQGETEIKNLSEETALLAIQGPLAQEILQKLTDESLDEIKFFKFKNHVTIAGASVLVSRTGYTGEDGFELYCRAEDAGDLWSAILSAGKEEGILPCGLGARDTLRFEACLPLYGQELSKDISPIEAGIGFAVKTKSERTFNGREALVQQRENGSPRKLAGLEMIDKGIPRHGYPVYQDGIRIGEVTTGTQSPTLKKNIGLALIGTEYSEPGNEVTVEIRGKQLKARVVQTPFYKRPKA